MKHSALRTARIVLALAAAFCLAGVIAAGTGCSCSSNTAANNDNTEEALNVSEKEVNEADVEAATPEPQTFLIIGNDYWEGYYETDRSDLMLLMRVDFEKGVINMVSVPRDARYTWEDGTVTKANEVYASQGAEGACKAVEQVTGCKVTNYINIGFDGLEAIVEQFGGLDMYVPRTITYTFYSKDHDAVTLNEGQQILDSWQTMVLCRARTGYKNYSLDQDMMRQCVDRQMLIALMKQAFTDKTKAAELLVSLLPNVETNIDTATIKSWAEALMKNDQLTVYATSGPTAGGIDADTQLWLCYDDPEAWAGLMEIFNQGGDTSTYDACINTTEASDYPIRTTTVIDLK